MAHIATLITVDPGVATGYALTHLYDTPQEGNHTDIRLGAQSLTVRTHGTTNMENAPDVFQLLAEHANYHTPSDVAICLIVEDFIITRTAMQKNTTWSSEVTGMAIAAARLTIAADRLTIDNTQSSSSMKNVVHNSKVLQAMGIKKRGDKMTGHEADALGHAVLYAARHNLKQVKLPKPPTLD